jgi:hypothetical protein
MYVSICFRLSRFIFLKFALFFFYYNKSRRKADKTFQSTRRHIEFIYNFPKQHDISFNFLFASKHTHSYINARTTHTIHTNKHARTHVRILIRFHVYALLSYGLYQAFPEFH